MYRICKIRSSEIFYEERNKISTRVTETLRPRRRKPQLLAGAFVCVAEAGKLPARTKTVHSDRLCLRRVENAGSMPHGAERVRQLRRVPSHLVIWSPELVEGRTKSLVTIRTRPFGRAVNKTAQPGGFVCRSLGQLEPNKIYLQFVTSVNNAC